MKIAYDYLLKDGNRKEIAFNEEAEFRAFLKEYKKEIDTVTATLDDGRVFVYERNKGWFELDTPF